jgi:phage terminase large subunit-like protein
VLERHQQEAPKLMDFEAAGELTLVKRMGDDIAELVIFIEQVEASELLDNIGVDQAGIGQIVDAIVGAGIAFERIVGIPQGWKLVGAIKTLERKLAEGTFEHGGQAIMAYAVSNAKAEPRGNATIITKQGAGNAKIDPLMATFDAVALMSMNPQPKRASFQFFFAGGGKPQTVAR